MKRKLLALKSRVSPSDRKENESKQDWSSPALDNARTVCQLLSNLGSGAINVPGLQAAGQVGMQIIDIIKVSQLLLINAPLINVSQKTKGNKTDYDDLVTRIVQLLDPIRKALENQSSVDVDLSLKEDLERFTEYVLYFLLPMLLLTMTKGLEKDSGHLKATSRSKRGRESIEFCR
jgi:hypothetical protein